MSRLSPYLAMKKTPDFRSGTAGRGLRAVDFSCSAARQYSPRFSWKIPGALFLSLCLPLTAQAAQTEQMQLSPAVPLAFDTSPEKNSADGAIKVQPYEIEVGKTVSIPADHVERYLIMTADVAEILSQSASDVTIKANRIGSTIILLWQAAGIKSVRIVVTPSNEVLKEQEKLEIESSELYRSRRERAFRFSYENNYSLLSSGKSFRTAEEERKIFDQRFGLRGETPYGGLEGSLLYEYRKDPILGKGVSVPRDSWIELRESKLGRVTDYDFTGGSRFLSLNSYAFPGARYAGFTMLPSLKRVLHPHKGDVLPYFFAGEERDGSLIDSPAGLRDRSLKDKLSGQGIDYYLWETGRLSLGAFERWDGTGTDKANRAFDGALDLQRGPFLLSGEGALDDGNRFTGDTKLTFLRERYSVSGSVFSSDKNYTTVTGSGPGRGLLDYRLEGRVVPVKNGLRETLAVDLSADLTKDVLSKNPNYSSDFSKTYWGRSVWNYSDSSFVETNVFYEDRRPTAFPVLHKKIDLRWNRDFYFLHLPLLNSLRVFLVGGAETYRKGVESRGFNANLFSAGGGFHLSFLYGFYVSAQYLAYVIQEKDLPAPPSSRTVPSEVTLETGFSRQFFNRLTFDTGVRFVNDSNTYDKTHQPFIQEDRVEGYSSFNFRLNPRTSVFVEGRALQSRSIVGLGPNVELSLFTGLRGEWESPIVIPQKGRIQGYYFKDLNGNGVKDENEPGLAGFEVTVEKGPREKSNGEGWYSIAAEEGVLTVKAADDLPAGYFYSTLNQKKIELLPGQSVRIDFGVTSQVQVKGRAFLDVNQNLFFDEGDVPLPGIWIRLSTGQSAVTTEGGYYSVFRVPPGPNKAALDVSSVQSGYRTLSPIEKEFTGEAGDVINYDIILGAERIASGVVFVDKDGDQNPGADELGVEGVVIAAEGNKAVTSRLGRYYLRNLPPGSHEITVDPASLPSDTECPSPSRKVEVPKGPFLEQNLNFPLRRRH